MKTVLVVMAALLLAGCSSTAHFVRSAPSSIRTNSYDDLLVFYSKADVPFEFKEIGRIFLTTTELTSTDAARDVKKIKTAAAHAGADAVIIQEKNRHEASAGQWGYAAAAQAQDVTEYFGIAIVKK